MTELIFEPTWVAANVPSKPARFAPFVHRLARATDLQYTTIRRQLEACWAEVTNPPRVLLGLLRSTQDVQHERARTVLYVGTALARLGWNVDWEFQEPDKTTPDFRLCKAGLEVLAEAVTPEIDDGSPEAKDTQRFVDAIAEWTADYGISVSELVFGREADPAVVRTHFETAMEQARANGGECVLGEYIAPGVSIRYQLTPLPSPMRCPYLGTTGTRFWGAVGRDELRAAIVKKIKKYKRPLVVVTGVPAVPTPDFEALAEAMYGAESCTFDRASGELLAVTRVGGLLAEEGEDGDLIRSHLIGVLGVTLQMPSLRLLHRLHQAVGAVPRNAPPPPELNYYRLRCRFFHARVTEHALADALLPVPQCQLRRMSGGFEVRAVGEKDWSVVPGDGAFEI